MKKCPPGCLGFIGDEKLPSYIVIIMLTIIRIPINQPGFNGKYPRVFLWLDSVCRSSCHLFSRKRICKIIVDTLDFFGKVYLQVKFVNLSNSWCFWALVRGFSRLGPFFKARNQQTERSDLDFGVSKILLQERFGATPRFRSAHRRQYGKLVTLDHG